jgi:hypothetical protein
MVNGKRVRRGSDRERKTEKKSGQTRKENAKRGIRENARERETLAMIKSRLLADLPQVLKEGKREIETGRESRKEFTSYRIEPVSHAKEFHSASARLFVYGRSVLISSTRLLLFSTVSITSSRSLDVADRRFLNVGL